MDVYIDVDVDVGVDVDTDMDIDINIAIDIGINIATGYRYTDKRWSSEELSMLFQNQETNQNAGGFFHLLEKEAQILVSLEQPQRNHAAVAAIVWLVMFIFGGATKRHVICVASRPFSAIGF